MLAAVVLFCGLLCLAKMAARVLLLLGRRIPDRFAEPRGRKSALTASTGNAALVVELPGIEPELLPGIMPSELLFRYVSFRFSPARYLRFRSRVLTASRVNTHQQK